MSYYGHLCDISTGYDIPVYLRNYYYKLLIDIKTKEAESYESKGNSPPSEKNIAKMPIAPR
jgi:hypothetical protein